jgi:hypothetical protein
MIPRWVRRRVFLLILPRVAQVKDEIVVVGEVILDS